MISKAKANLLQQHQNNADLNISVPPVTMLSDKDLSADAIRVPIDAHIIAEASRALEQGNTHYVDVPGIAPLREAIANYLNQQSGSSFALANMMVTAGVQESRFLTIQKASEEFDNHIAVPEVVHPGVRKAIGIRPRRTMVIAVDPSLSALPSIENIERALKAGSRLLYLESPARLTGEIYSRDAVEQIGQLAVAHDATIIWDQGLAPWVQSVEYASLAGQDNLHVNTIAIGEAWPGAGLASWYIGYIAAPEYLVPAMQSHKQIMAICTSTPTQFAALEASRLFQDHHATHFQQMTEIKSQILDLAKHARLETVKGQAANVLALRLSDSDKERIRSKLEANGYQFTDGSVFGASHLIRLNVGHAAKQALQELI